MQVSEFIQYIFYLANFEFCGTVCKFCTLCANSTFQSDLKNMFLTFFIAIVENNQFYCCIMYLGIFRSKQVMILTLFQLINYVKFAQYRTIFTKYLCKNTIFFGFAFLFTCLHYTNSIKKKTGLRKVRTLCTIHVF